MLSLVVSRGYDAAWAIDLPVPCFSDLVESVSRVAYREKVEAAYTMAFATQASGDELKQYVEEALEPLTGRKPKKAKAKPKPRSI